MRFLETASDTTIGILLIVVSFLILAVCAVPLYGALWLLSQAVGFVTTRTGIPSNLWFLAFISLVALINFVRNIRTQLWRNAVLSFAVILIAAAEWFKGGLSPHESSWIFPYWLLIATSTSRKISPWQFASGSALIAVGSLYNFGLLGDTGWARRVDGILTLGMFTWTYFFYIRPELKPDSREALASSG